MVKIAPSILSADFARLGEQVSEIEKCGADIVHIDVMDGMFVPNISFGAPIMKSIRQNCNLPFDVHLMIEEPARYIEEFVNAGADIITVHYEADRHIDRTINYIKSFGRKAGVALNPGTPVNVLQNIIEEVDMVLVMSVNPGFGGQKYINYCGEKIKEVRNMIDKSGKDIMLEVDGGISYHNIGEVVNCGANVIVAGSAVFNQSDVDSNLKKLRAGYSK